jgi:subtilisin family serine protease
VKRRIFIVLLAMLVSCGGHNRSSEIAAYKEGEVIVKFKSGTDVSKRNSAHLHMRTASVREIDRRGLQRVVLARGLSVKEAIGLYEKNPDVEYAEPNYIVRASALPDDPLFSEQWGLWNTGQVIREVAGMPDADVDAVEAWDITRESSAVVALIDSGVDVNHPDLLPNLVQGYDFLDDDGVPDDLNGHGTHLAGIIGAVGNNRYGVAGINWRTKIMPLKVLDRNGEGVLSDIIEAVDYAGKNGARIVNMSFTFVTAGTGEGRPLYDTIAAYPSLLFVAAAGNSSRSTDSIPENPGSFDLPNIINVASSDQGDNLAEFSNYGQVSVDLAAPGDSIISTIPSFGTATSFSGSFVTVYLAFGLECIVDTSTQRGVVERALGFLGVRPGDRVLVVDDDGGDFFETSYARTLGDLGYSYDLVSVPRSSDGPSESELEPYKLVVWFTAGEFTNTLTAADQTSLQAYLTDGGRLLLSGQDIGYDIGESSFYRDFLHSVYVTDDALGLRYNGSGFMEGVFTGLPEVCTDGRSRYPVIPDAVTPDIGGSVLFQIAYDDAFQFISGTSMSSAFVSGIAALAFSHFPSLNAIQLKELLLANVDAKESLQEKVFTGGRVNTFRALSAPLPPAGLAATAQAPDTVLLTWSTTSSDQSGFEIERRQAGGSFSKAGETTGAVSAFTDADLQSGVTYIYRVRAVNSTSFSPYSNEAPVKTPSGVIKGGGGGGGGCAIGIGRSDAFPDALVLSLPLAVLLLRKLRRLKRE